tara:strand:- start:2003 stop:2224 length:222 start_codon:yes stop_codon:yes gene_type:complete
MEQLVNNVKSIIGGLKGILIAAAGLLIIAQIVFGSAGFDVVGNLTALIDGFIGSSASLVSIIAGIIVLGLLSD